MNTFPHELMAILLIFGAFLIIAGLIWVVINIIAWWRLFTKAGESGWKVLVPFLGGHTQYKIAWHPAFFWATLLIAIVDMILWQSGNTFLGTLSWIFTLANAVIGIIYWVKLSYAFGQGVGFAVGLIFLNPIFLLILAFGKSQYVGPGGKASGQAYGQAHGQTYGTNIPPTSPMNSTSTYTTSNSMNTAGSTPYNTQYNMGQPYAGAQNTTPTAHVTPAPELNLHNEVSLDNTVAPPPDMGYNPQVNTAENPFPTGEAPQATNVSQEAVNQTWSQQVDQQWEDTLNQQQNQDK